METLTRTPVKDIELRKNNWVRARTAFDSPTEVQVHTIEATTINGSIPFEDLEGIELTKERLKKLGFVDGDKETKEGLITVTTMDKMVGVSGTDACTDGHAFWVQNVRYLHQLQNLFYFLTGTEL